MTLLWVLAIGLAKPGFGPSSSVLKFLFLISLLRLGRWRLWRAPGSLWNLLWSFHLDFHLDSFGWPIPAPMYLYCLFDSVDQAGLFLHQLSGLLRAHFWGRWAETALWSKRSCLKSASLDWGTLDKVPRSPQPSVLSCLEAQARFRSWPPETCCFGGQRATGSESLTAISWTIEDASQSHRSNLPPCPW